MTVLPASSIPMQKGGCTVTVTVWGTNVVWWNWTQRKAVDPRKSPSMFGLARATVSPPNAPARSADSSGSEGGVSGAGLGGITSAPSLGFSSWTGHGAGGQARRPQARACPWTGSAGNANHATPARTVGYFGVPTKPIV